MPPHPLWLPQTGWHYDHSSVDPGPCDFHIPAFFSSWIKNPLKEKAFLYKLDVSKCMCLHLSQMESKRCIFIIPRIVFAFGLDLPFHFFLIKKNFFFLVLDAHPKTTHTENNLMHFLFRKYFQSLRCQSWHSTFIVSQRKIYPLTEKMKIDLQSKNKGGLLQMPEEWRK